MLTDRELQSLRNIGEWEAADEIEKLRAALTAACDRMDRARGILTNDNPRPDCNWGMLDARDLRPNDQVKGPARQGRSL
jgi:hypothetical protein